jgi:hypothetical protein
MWDANRHGAPVCTSSFCWNSIVAWLNTLLLCYCSEPHVEEVTLEYQLKFSKKLHRNIDIQKGKFSIRKWKPQRLSANVTAIQFTMPSCQRAPHTCQRWEPKTFIHSVNFPHIYMMLCH